MFYKSTILYGSLFYRYQCSLQSKIIATENRDPIDNRMFSLTFFLPSNYTSRLSESHILWPHRVFCDLLYTLIIPCANNNSDEFFFFWNQWLSFISHFLNPASGSAQCLDNAEYFSQMKQLCCLDSVCSCILVNSEDNELLPVCKGLRV